VKSNAKQDKTPKRNRAPKKGGIVLNFEATTGTDLKEAMEEARVNSKIMPIQPEESQGEKQPVKAKPAKPAPEFAPEAMQWFSLDEFLRNELVAHKGHPKVTRLDIVEKYQAAATAA
jgi:hypothetical protein